MKLPHTYPPEQCGELEKVFTGENYSVWKGEKSIALIDSNAKKSGLVLPVTNNNYIVEHVTVIRPGNLDSMRIIFAASYSKPVFTGDISFVSPSCPEILKRHVIHIPFKVLCLTTVNNNNQVVVAVENNHKDDSKWHVCFCHYDLVDDKFVNLGKYYSFDSSSGALYHKNDVKIQLDKNLTKFTACDIPGKQEVKRQIICTHNKKYGYKFFGFRFLIIFILGFMLMNFLRLPCCACWINTKMLQLCELETLSYGIRLLS